MHAYLTYVPGQQEDLAQLPPLQGTEVFMNDMHPRAQLLFEDEGQKAQWMQRFAALNVRRLHCSYWPFPTYILTQSRHAEFVQRMEGAAQVRKVYGDGMGRRLFARWVQEYELACALQAQAYVFHVIDYAAIDGQWEFTLTRAEIAQAMIGMVQRLLLLLEEKGLLGENSPVIELENAGFGLEYGLQRSEDFADLFAQLYDPWDKVRIGWDLNHLLHAIGRVGTGAGFHLRPEEITPRMARLQQRLGGDVAAFAAAWIAMNILDESVVDKTGSLHLSDCALKEEAYFVNGRLTGRYGERIDAIEGFDEKGDYGVGLVLQHYDSHLPLGQGVLRAGDVRGWIQTLRARCPGFVLLHELKNSAPLLPDLQAQLAFLERD